MTTIPNWESLKFNSTLKQKSFGVPPGTFKTPTKFKDFNLSISQTAKIESKYYQGTPSILNAIHYSKEMPRLRPHMVKYPNNVEGNVEVGALKGNHYITIKEFGPHEPEYIRDNDLSPRMCITEK